MNIHLIISVSPVKLIVAIEDATPNHHHVFWMINQCSNTCTCILSESVREFREREHRQHCWVQVLGLERDPVTPHRAVEWPYPVPSVADSQCQPCSKVPRRSVHSRRLFPGRDELFSAFCSRWSKKWGAAAIVTNREREKIRKYNLACLPIFVHVVRGSLEISRVHSRARASRSTKSTFDPNITLKARDALWTLVYTVSRQLVSYTSVLQ